MRAEDRKPSKRVFPLLQNLDLDTVTFDQVQGVGDPISIEDMNEQEMVDLIIVNLARLAVAGEWTGLLEAGGGGGGGQAGTLVPYSATAYADDYMEMLHSSAPWGNVSNGGSGLGTDLLLWPFVASNTGTISEASIYVSYSPGGTCTVQAGIYNDVDGQPTDLIGYAEFDCSSAGMKTQTSFSATIELTIGTQYWYSYLSTSTNVPNLERTDENDLPSIGIVPDHGLYLAGRGVLIDANVQAQDDPITLSGITPGDTGRMSLGIKY